MNTTTTTTTAYLPLVEDVDIQPAFGRGQYHVIDAAQSLGKRFPVIVGHVSIIRGFIHYVGDRYSAHQGIEAVIKPSYTLEDGSLQCGDPIGALVRALREGIRSGRRDDLS